MKTGGVCPAIAISGLLLLGCSDDGETIEPEDAAATGEEEPAEAEEDLQAEVAAEPDPDDGDDAPAVGDVIEGTYDAGPPREGGEATGCTWLVTDEETFTLVHFGGDFDEELRAQFDGYVLELDGIGRIEEGQHMDAAEQIVAVGEQLRLTVTEVHTIADFGPIRDGCGEEDDLLLEFDEVEPVG